MSIAELSRASAPSRSGEVGDAPAQDIAPKTALVPVTAVLQPSRWRGQNTFPSEAPFLAHLIATAEQIPQTRPLRRATAAEAQAAYRSVPQNQQTVTGVRIRQNA